MSIKLARKKTLLRRHLSIAHNNRGATSIISLLSVLASLVIWQILAQYKIIDPLFLSSPLKIFETGFELFESGELNKHILASLKEFAGGFSLALIFGIVFGILVGWNKTLHRIFNPYIFALNAAPAVVFIPLVMIWFGLGLQSKIIIVFLMSVVPILINVIDGVKNLNYSFVKMAKSFRAKESLILRAVVFPSVLPNIFSGIRISVGRAMIGVIIAELYGASRGLGYLLSFYGSTFQIDKLMTVSIIIILTSIFLIKGLGVLERKIFKWKAEAKN